MPLTDTTEKGLETLIVAAVNAARLCVMISICQMACSDLPECWE